MKIADDRIQPPNVALVSYSLSSQVVTLSNVDGSPNAATGEALSSTAAELLGVK